MRVAYGRSPWIDRFPKSRVPSYPAFKGSLDVDVAIIGGGLTGCATAYAFAAAGIKVALFEAETIGRGATGSACGWIAETPGSGFEATERQAGRRVARHAWQAWRRAALDFPALIRRLDLKCQLAPAPEAIVARTPDDAQRLAREHKARKEAGFDAALLSARAAAAVTGFGTEGALRTRDAATLDPYRAAIGLAAAAADRGARIFERSAVTRTTFTRHTSAVLLAAGQVNTHRIVVATGGPTALFKPLARHFDACSTFNVLTEPVPARIRKPLGTHDHLLRDCDTPPHRIAWVDDERLLIGGADTAAVPPRTRDKVLIQRTGQLMYELSTFYPDISGLMPAFGWDTPYWRTSNGLPVIGPHRNYPFHLFAFGDASQSVTGAFLASRVLLRLHADEPQPSDAAFAFGH